MSKLRILFVDDEKQILDGLRVLFRKERKRWAMGFALGGPAALEALAQMQFDVVVSDMRMPEIDGYEVLKHVRDNYPHMVRIVLSGQTDPDKAAKVATIAHQFVSKPADPDHLREVIDRSSNLQRLLDRDDLRGVVAKMDSLPAVPKIFQELKATLGDPDKGIGDVSGIIQRDGSLSAKVLQVVNSAFFGPATTVTNIQRAVSYLGSSMIESVVLGHAVFGVPCAIRGFSIEDQNEHGMKVSRVAQAIAPEKPIADAATAAGLLHDAGKIVFASNLPEKYGEVLKRVAAGECELEAEREVFGVTHAEVGAFMLGLWCLPYEIVEAVAHHHNPSGTEATKFDLLTVLHAAAAICDQLEGRPFALDEAYLQRVGVADAQLQEWRQIAQDALGVEMPEDGATAA